MTHVSMRLMIATCALVALLLPTAPLSAQIPDEFTNLEVLDKDIGKQELLGIMKSFASSLGVRCNHCHVGPDNLQGMDFATDEKEHKRAARSMLEMAIAINSQYMGSWEEAGSEGKHQQVSCFTCHRGQPKPPRKLSSILSETVEAEGIDAAMAKYQELKAEYDGAGLYDFTEHTFVVLAQAAFEAGKTDDAMQILQSALELFPKSADLHSLLGMVLLQTGDVQGAAAKFDEALALDPESDSARRGKMMLERMQQQDGG